MHLQESRIISGVCCHLIIPNDLNDVCVAYLGITCRKSADKPKWPCESCDDSDITKCFTNFMMHCEILMDSLLLVVTNVRNLVGNFINYSFIHSVVQQPQQTPTSTFVSSFSEASALND